ncbi:MAG: hypothetical protein AAB438_00740 [Patescibacteria group bacterium]
MRKDTLNLKNGYITLISVLVISAISISVTISLLLLGLGSSRTSFAVQQSDQAKGLADACAEEGLEQIRSDVNFVGNGNLILGNGTCTYNVVNNGGQNRTIDATGTVDSVIRKVSVIINDINPLIVVVSWQEVP